MSLVAAAVFQVVVQLLGGIKMMECECRVTLAM